MTRQVRIFVPDFTPHEVWAEAVIYKILRPLVKKYTFNWYWFTRYVQPVDGDTGDCIFNMLPEGFLYLDKYHRSVRFRYDVKDVAAVEIALGELLGKNSYWYSDFRNYDMNVECCQTEVAVIKELYYPAARFTLTHLNHKDWYQVCHVIGNMQGLSI